MVNYKKTFFLLTLFIIFLKGLTSCADDKKTEIEEYSRDIATVNKSENNANDFTLDDGTRLWVGEPADFSLKVTSKRVLIDYSIISTSQDKKDCVVKLNGYYEVPTKEVIYINNNPAELDTIGNDPIKIVSLWLGGSYLNIYFEFNTAGKIKHRIDLIESSASLEGDVITLELRHNQMNDPEYFPVKGYICFNLASFENSARDELKFDIRWLDNFGKKKSYLLNYKKNKTIASIPAQGITNKKI